MSHRNRTVTAVIILGLTLSAAIWSTPTVSGASTTSTESVPAASSATKICTTLDPRLVVHIAQFPSLRQ